MEDAGCCKEDEPLLKVENICEIHG